jgi:hypothetical protein
VSTKGFEIIQYLVGICKLLKVCNEGISKVHLTITVKTALKKYERKLKPSKTVVE